MGQRTSNLHVVSPLRNLETLYAQLSHSEKVEKVGIVWQSVRKILGTHKHYPRKKKKSLEAKLFPDTERHLRATRLCPKTWKALQRKNFSKRVTWVQSRVRFDHRQPPPARRRTQTGLSESQMTLAGTCFAGGRKGRSRMGSARLSPTLTRPRPCGPYGPSLPYGLSVPFGPSGPSGPSGLCELCADACWGRTWCGKPGRKCRKWTSSRGPSWVWTPRGTRRLPPRLRCRLERASPAPVRSVCVEIEAHRRWTAPQRKDLILLIPGEDISQCFPARLHWTHGWMGRPKRDGRRRGGKRRHGLEWNEGGRGGL